MKEGSQELVIRGRDSNSLWKSKRGGAQAAPGAVHSGAPQHEVFSARLAEAAQGAGAIVTVEGGQVPKEMAVGTREVASGARVRVVRNRSPQGQGGPIASQAPGAPGHSVNVGRRGAPDNGDFGRTT